MSTLGDAEVYVSQSTAGKIRLIDVALPLAISPRLMFRFSYSLNLSSDWLNKQGMPPDALVIDDVVGELSWNDATAICPVSWHGPAQAMISGRHNYEPQFKMYADIDWPRLMRIEELRSGRGPQFKLSLWPRGRLQDQRPEIRVGDLQFRVPIEDWIAILNGLGPTRATTFQVMVQTSWSSGDSALAVNLREARERFDRGQYDGALASCRRALEALAQEIAKGDPADVIREFVTSRFDTKKADAINSIVAKTRHLASLSLHETGAAEFSRIEAEMAIRITEALVSALSSIRTGK
jgi:hypothetical protein